MKRLENNHTINGFYAITKQIFNSQLFIPIFLLIITILAYGLLIPFLGLYWDGWPYLWQYHVFGIEGFPDFVSSDRPFSAFIFMFFTWLFGESVLPYHLSALIFRWLSALVFYRILEHLWKDNKQFNFYTSALFLVYPGFLQQPIALPYIHHLSHFVLFLLSLDLMLVSLKNPKRYLIYTILSLSASAAIFSLEYFASLELIRPFLIWLFIKNNFQNKKPSLQKMARIWMPFLIFLIFFLVWRVFIFQFPTYQPALLEELSLSNQTALNNIFLKITNDLITVTLTAWRNILITPSPFEYGYTAVYAFLFLTIISLLFFFFVTLFLEILNGDNHPQPTRLKQIILIGILSIIFAGGIVWITKLPVAIEFAWDRLTLPFIFGVSITLTGLLIFIIKNKILRAIMFSFLISGAIGSHFLNAVNYIHDWENFQHFFWQLVWRAPQLESGTILLTANFPLKYYSDNSLTAPLNWTYNQDSSSNELNYLFYYTDVRLKTGSLPSLSKNIEINRGYRSFYFDGSTNNVLVIRYKPPGCLQILDPIYTNAGVIPNLSQMEADQIPLSNLNQIITNPEKAGNPPLHIFSIKEELNWCYFFEKADLARQMGEWNTIIQIQNQVTSKHLHPRVQTEWLPFLDAHLHLANYQDAEEIIQKVITVENGRFAQGVCLTLKRNIEETTNTDHQEYMRNILTKIGC